MREYLRFFRIPFIAFGILLVIVAIASFGRKTSAEERNNDECTTDERVFDYADRLTDDEEEKLRDQIAKTEKKIEADIIIVTLDESLEEYALEYDPYADMDEYVMIYADNFYDEHKFGYNKPIGDGVLFLDNIGEEADGVKYVAISTCGKAEQKYSHSMLVRLRDDALKYIDVHPYRAYSDFVKQVEKDLSQKGAMTGMAMLAKPHITLLAAAVVTAIFLLINLSARKGKKTTTAHSYVNGGQPTMRGREDRFLHKHVTSRVIESSSGGGGGGGGGHHTSSGGASHGGITGGR